jgi:diguanylate cyclase (GGDEF)-like protein
MKRALDRRETELRQVKMHAALDATTEAVLQAKSPDELFELVCACVLRAGELQGVSIFLCKPGEIWTSLAATAGAGGSTMGQVGVSVDAARPEGRGLIGRAFRSLRPCIANDFLHDERLAPWRALAAEQGCAAAAALPLVVDGACAGVLWVSSTRVGVFDDGVMGLLEHIGKVLSYALNAFAKDALRSLAEQKLRDNEAKFRSLTGLSSDWYWLQDAQLRFTHFGEHHGTEASELPLGAMLGKCVWDFWLPNESGAERQRHLVEHGQPFRDLLLHLDMPDGSSRYLGISGEPVLDSDGSFAGYRGVGRDVTRRAVAERRNERLAKMYGALMATGEAVLRSVTVEELCQAVCDAAVQGSRFTATTVLFVEPGQPWLKVVGTTGLAGQLMREVRISIDESLPQGRGLAGIAFRTQRASVSNDWPSDERSAPWREAVLKAGNRSVAALPLLRNGRVDGVLMFYSDQVGEFDDEMVSLLLRLAENVSFALEKFQQDAERKLAEARIQHMALYDGLTALPNRTMITQLLRTHTHANLRYGRPSAVMFIDLDGFKAINDTLGHEAGDLLLSEVASRLVGVVRASDTAGRLGGDEFVILLEGVALPEQAEAIARKIIHAVGMPIAVLGRDCIVTASIGISLCPVDGRDEKTLLRTADEAMYSSKQRGGNTFSFYS